MNKKTTTTTEPTAAITSMMHRHVLTTDVSTTAKECAKLLAQNRVGCLIIVKHNSPVGIITERSFVDLVKKGGFSPNKVIAADFMSSPLITLRSSAHFADAMQLFNTKGIKRVPVVKRGKIVGLLSLTDMIEYSNVALAKLTATNRKLKSQATIDPLTGVLNKAAITRTLQREYERIRRYGGRSSILFIDIDHFKKVNDTHSHLVGDKVLKQLGDILRKTCREIDVIGRFGGEEFIVVAPNRKKYHAISFGERLRKAVETHTFRCNKLRLKLTVSIGIASLFVGRDYTIALERADKALYFAKESGRNRLGLFRDGQLAIATQ